jgi:hypothetical protein
MAFEDLGVVRIGDALDPGVVPVHDRRDTDESAGDALSHKRSFLQRSGERLFHSTHLRVITYLNPSDVAAHNPQDD